MNIERQAMVECKDLMAKKVNKKLTFKFLKIFYSFGIEKIMLTFISESEIAKNIFKNK